MALRRCCILTSHFYSLHQPTLNNTLNIQVPRTCYFLSFRFNSIDNSSSYSERNQAAEVNRNSDDDRKIKFIQLELSYLHQRGKRVPDPNLIERKDWDELLNFSTKSARKNFYMLLFNRQAHQKYKKVCCILKAITLRTRNCIMNDILD